MRYLTTLGFLITLMFSIHVSHAQLNWGLQSTPVTEQITDIYFISTTEGWAVGDLGVILHTTDAGANWVEQWSGTFNKLTDVQFNDSETGWAVGESGTTLRTTDGGDTWLNTDLGTSNKIEGLYFVDDQLGYCVGDDGIYGLIFKTIDGGVTWSQQGVEISPFQFFKVHFVSADTGWVCGRNSIFRTNDGGSTWIDQNSTGSIVSYLEGLWMNSSSEGWVVGDGGTVLHTDDGGSTWLPKDPGVSGYYYWDVQFISPTEGIIVGDLGVVYTTSDGGANWDDESLPALTDLSGIFVADINAIWTCGDDGEIYRSPAQYNDLILTTIIDSDTLCAGQSAFIQIALENIGGTPISSAVVTASNGVDVIGTQTLTNTLNPGDTTSFIMAEVNISSDTTFILTIIGDSLTDNNILVQNFYAVEPSFYTITPDLEVCSGASASLLVTGGESYFWDNASTDSTNALQIVTVTEERYYTVAIHQQFCSVNDSVYVSFANCDNTNAFSPNNDGINDFFHIDGVEGTENTVIIYNRWGDVAIEFANYNNLTKVWGGKSQDGTPMAPGTYYYTVEIKDTGVKKSGWVQIVR